jgi:hypothetical protein
MSMYPTAQSASRLRVGVIGPAFPDSFADNIASGLATIGHESTLLGSSRPLHNTGGLEIVSNALLRSAALDRSIQRSRIGRAVRGLDLDLIISVESWLAPEVVKALRSDGTPVVLWYPDHVGNLGRQLMFWAEYDRVFTKEPTLVARASRLKVGRLDYLPEACNSTWHRPQPAREPSGKVVVAGTMYPYRVRILERLRDEGVQLELYGPSFPRWLSTPRLEAAHAGRYLARLDKARVFQNSTAVLNTMHPAEIEGVNARVFEAAACGGLVISEWRPTLEEHFRIGEELLAFAGFDELLHHVRWAENEPEAAAEVALRGSARALREHTYEIRLEALIARTLSA